jgi:hypothetical protein
MSSLLQIAANQANAAKSTGPKSPEGKRNSSRNGIKHGLCSKVIVLDGESEAIFKNLLRSYFEEYLPATPTERDLVESMVMARWRINRVIALETAGVNYQISLQPPEHAERDAATRAMLVLRDINSSTTNPDHLRRYEATWDRHYHRSLNQLLRLRAEKTKITMRTQSDDENKGVSL